MTLLAATLRGLTSMLSGLSSICSANRRIASEKVDKKRKAELFLHLLRTQHWKQVLVFAKTRNGVDELVGKLQALGINADGIHGDKPQATRQRALDRFKASEMASPF